MKSRDRMFNKCHELQESFTSGDLSFLTSFVHKTSWTFAFFSLQEDQLGLSLLTVEQVESEEFQKRILQSAVAWFCKRGHLPPTWVNLRKLATCVDGPRYALYIFLDTMIYSNCEEEAWRVKNRDAFTYRSLSWLSQNMIIMKVKASKQHAPNLFWIRNDNCKKWDQQTKTRQGQSEICIRPFGTCIMFPSHCKGNLKVLSVYCVGKSRRQPNRYRPTLSGKKIRLLSQE